MPPSIIHVPRRYVSSEWGGTETVINEIAKRQQAAGFSARIVTSMALSDSHHEKIAGIPVDRHRYCYPYFGLSSEDKNSLDKKGGNLLSLSLFTSLLKEKEARIFHAHSLKRLGGSVATAARLLGKPFVVSLHGGVFDVPTSELESMHQPVVGKLEWGKPFGALFGSRSVLENADLVICVGENEAEAAKTQLGHDRVTYLPNGVDTKRFSSGDGRIFREGHGIKASEFVILNVGRIDAQKNQLGLVEAFARFSQTRNNTRLVLVGPETQSDYARKLKSAILRSGLSHRILLLPGIAPDDPTLLDTYDACDIFAIPSTHEPFGIAALEAWSAGKPVVASAVGGLTTLIEDGRTGLHSRNGDDLIEQFIQLYRAPSLRHNLSRAGQEEAAKRYDWSIIHDRLEGLYQRAENHSQAS